MTKAERKKVGRLQDLIGAARAFHGNDRDRDGFEKGQKALTEAFNLVVELLAPYPPEWNVIE